MDPADLFKLMDTNSDGSIDAAELQRWCALVHLPQSTVQSLLSALGAGGGGGGARITLPAFRAALSRQVRPSDLLPHLPAPPASGAAPSVAAVEAAFAALRTRPAPPGCLHVDDLKVALLDALPGLDRARAARAAAAAAAAAAATHRRPTSARQGGGGGSGAGAEPQPHAQPPLRVRIEALVSTLTPTASGHVRYSELVTLLMR